MSGTTIFDFPKSIFIHFHNKIVSAQRNTRSIQILYTRPPKERPFRGEFLFVRRKCHARFKSVFFFTSSHGVGLLFTYKVSDVVFVTKHFALKITLKF